MKFLVNRVQIPTSDVLHGVTGLAAEALGIEDRVGTLAPGKLADIVVVDGDPLVDISAMERIHIVVKDGELVFNNGRLRV